MIHGKSLLERPAEDEKHSKLFHVVFCGEAIMSAEKLRSEGERGGSAQRRTRLNRQGNVMFETAKKRSCKAVSW